MKISLSHKCHRAGFALIIVMSFVVVSLIIFGSVMFWLSSSIKQTAQNNAYTSSEAAAEGATEMAFAQMDHDFLMSTLGGESTYYKLLPVETGWPIQFIFSDTNGFTNQISINIGPQSSDLEPLGNEYANLQGQTQTVVVTATATPVGQIYNQPATVTQTFDFATVPAFQFAIFYNINLEIDPGATMPIAGAVFSNGGIWSGNANPTYSSSVEAAGQVTITGTDPFAPNKTDSGTPQANFLEAGQPVSSVSPLEIPIGASTNNSETNVIAIIQLPPAGVAAPQAVAYAQSNQVYTFNAATLIVSNWSSGTHPANTSFTPTGNNFSVYLQDPWHGPSWTAPSVGNMNQLTNDFYVVTNSLSTIVTPNLFSLTNIGFTASAIHGLFPLNPTANANITWTSGTNHYGVQYAGWSFLTNVAFYDYRESDTVQAVQVDVGMLRTWITNNSVTGGSNWNYALAFDKGSGINSMYVYNAVPINTSQLPAVRVMDGIRLPNSTNVINSTNNITSGLSVVTPQPLYVWQDYNLQIDGDASTKKLGTNDMAHTYPAAFMADAITILSDSWRDTYISSTALTSRTPSVTAITAACLEGIVQSSSNYPSITGVTGYSGGVENFLRLLENWSGSTPLTYNGSIMVMFPSQYATNFWQSTGQYYNAPLRVWSFDTNFMVSKLLPPLTPKFTTVIRSTWNGD